MTHHRRVLIIAAALCGAGLGLFAAAQPPATRADNVTDTIHGTAFVDPYRWLEDQTARTRADGGGAGDVCGAGAGPPEVRRGSKRG
jgi:hypothetical protein